MKRFLLLIVFVCRCQVTDAKMYRMKIVLERGMLKLCRGVHLLEDLESEMAIHSRRRLELVNTTQAVELLDLGLMDLLAEICADERLQSHEGDSKRHSHKHEHGHEHGQGSKASGETASGSMGSRPAGGSLRRGGFHRNGGGAAMGSKPEYGTAGNGFMHDKRRWRKAGSEHGGHGGKGGKDHAGFRFGPMGDVSMTSGPEVRTVARETGPAGKVGLTLGTIVDIEKVNKMKLHIVQATKKLCRLAKQVEFLDNLKKRDEESSFADLMFDACYFLESSQGDGSIPENILPRPEATTRPPRTTGLPISGRSMEDKPGFLDRLVKVCKEMDKLGENVAFARLYELHPVDEAALMDVTTDLYTACTVLVDLVENMDANDGI